ncbi:hypothetical protein [Novosphingobium profundi]|uniref:hypothetical protein n=1 Tax=Novosphingobium profundi TaxID=1774954 RepID=UPI001CFE6764|nr:hypothetical protein [Novosphingobium profundi]
MRKVALRWLALALVVAVSLRAFGTSLDTAWDKVRADPPALGWPVIAAWLLFAAAVPVSGWLWGRVLQRLESTRVGAADAIVTHCFSWLLKYLPGQIAALVYKLVWAEKRGLGKTGTGLSFVYENLFVQVASWAPALLILPHATLGARIGNDSLLAACGALAAMVTIVFALGPGVGLLLKLVRKRGKLTAGQGQFGTLSPAASARFMALYLLPRLLNAVAFVLICLHITPVEPAQMPALGAIYVLAGAIGVLAVFVPSGLGVREAAIILLAAPLLGSSTAIIAAFLARFVSIASDALVLVFAIALRALHVRNPV